MMARQLGFAALGGAIAANSRGHEAQLNEW